MNLLGQITDQLGEPPGSAKLVERRLAKRELSVANASKLLGVSHSTLSRYLAGGSLTVNLAAKLAKLDLDVSTLFNLEAAKNAYQAKQLISA